MWNVSNAVCKEMFEAVLADFAKSIGVGNNKRVVIQLDSPELRPAEHLWQFVDEPLANTYF